MCAERMHADEVHIDAALVRRLDLSTEPASLAAKLQSPDPAQDLLQPSSQHHHRSVSWCVVSEVGFPRA
jgi:hypothetical protein